MKKRINKKASATDMIFIAIVLTFFAIVTLISFKITNTFNAEIQTNSIFPTEAKTSTSSLTNIYSGTLDNMSLFVLIGLTIASIALASLVRIHPIFIAFFFIVYVFIIFISAILSNVYTEMASHALLITEANQLTMMGFILGKLPFIIGIIGIIIMVIMYKTWSNSQ